MKLQKTLCLTVIICLLLCLIGCGKKEDTSAFPEAGDEPSAAAPSEKFRNVDFSGMPAIDMPMVKMHPGKDTLLFEFINPGMDSSETTLVNYSLSDNKLLCQVDLGDGIFSVKADQNGGFSVFDINAAEGHYYSADGKVTKTVQVSCVEKGGAAFIAQGGEKDKLLVSDMRSGELYLVTADGKSKTKVDLPADAYEVIGSTDGKFVVSQGAQNVYMIGQDGTAQQLFSKGGVQTVNRDYAAGRVVDSMVFLPLEEGDPLFTKVHEPEEMMRAGGDGVFLTVTAKETASTLRLYRMAKRKTASYTVNGTVEAAAVVSDGQIVIALRDGNGFAFQLLDPDTWEEEEFLSENDLSDALGTVAIPKVGSKDETDAYTKQIEEQYNIRFLYEPCELLEQMETIGMTATLPTDRKLLLSVEKHLVECFSFLPDEVWKNIGGSSPLLVFLCESIPGNVAGYNFEFDSYNCIFMEIGGNDSYYTSTFFHEIGHAIDRCVMRSHPELIDEWDALTPAEVRAAVERGTVDGTNAITVEFTPDDKSGNVCYVAPYAMTNAEEDRAMTFASFYETVYEKEDASLFSHEVLKKKAAHFGKMIHAAFPLNEGTVLPFDSF